MSANIILCGGVRAKGKRAKDAKVVELDTSLSNANIHLEISDITRKMVENLPPILTDILEVAAYIYCADQLVRRGGDKDVDFGAKWRREFNFHIPVREPDIWSTKPVMEKLAETLRALSGDYLP